LSEDIVATDLDTDARAELLSLAKPVAETVARHLVATGRLIDEDPDQALAHALAARRLAARIAAVREAVGLAAYHAGQWQTALSELRTYHRMSGRQTHLAILADCERALGRPERAIDMYRSADRSALDVAGPIELLIVAAGARVDLGQKDAAVAMLQVRELTAPATEPWAARLRYAYADALLEVGRRDEAREWFARAAEADDDAQTDAAERLLELDGVLLDGDDEDFDADADAQPTDDDGAHGVTDEPSEAFVTGDSGAEAPRRPGPADDE
jgi:tetratricopeptide (TPR) repeat protein